MREKKKKSAKKKQHCLEKKKKSKRYVLRSPNLNYKLRNQKKTKKNMKKLPKGLMKLKILKNNCLVYLSGNKNGIKYVISISCVMEA